MGLSNALNRIVMREDLSAAEAGSAVGEILAGGATPGQIGGFLIGLQMKGVTVDEMTGMLRALLDAAETVTIPGDPIDTCGTGGSGQRREAAFHISTTAAFVAAGAGARVCKHGNRKASATSGSADVLEALGVAVELGAEGVAQCVEKAGMAFFLAPRFHPGMRHPGPVRRELGVRTVFNLLGPLANPARVKRQVVGVADGSLAETIAHVLRANGSERVMVVYGHDGLDELTTASTSTIVELREGEIHARDVDPKALGLAPVDKAPSGGDTATNVDLIRRVLDGEPGPHRDIVVLNAGAAIVVAGLAADLGEGVALARASIDDGKAAAVLAQLVATSQSVV